MWNRPSLLLPADGAIVWCRAPFFYASPFLAYYSYYNQSFISLDSGVKFQSSLVGRWKDSVYSSLTARTIAFCYATGVYDYTTLLALSNMDASLISSGLDLKVLALYPVVGSSKFSCQFNFMNPLDSDAAFRLSFTDGWSFGASGIITTLSTAYANTFYVESVRGLLNDSHISFYCNTNSSTGAYVMGVQTSNYQLMHLVNTGACAFGINSTALPTYNLNASIIGLFTTSRTVSTNVAFYKNGTQLTNPASTSGTRPALPIYIGTYNFNGIAATALPRVCSFASIGRGLSSSDVTAFSTIVSTLMTDLGR